jgi:hypothetical protein
MICCTNGNCVFQRVWAESGNGSSVAIDEVNLLVTFRTVTNMDCVFLAVINPNCERLRRLNVL